MQTAHLAENHLLARLGGDGLSEQLSNFAAIKMIDKSPDSALTITGELLVEIHELADLGIHVSKSVNTNSRALLTVVNG